MVRWMPFLLEWHGSEYLEVECGSGGRSRNDHDAPEIGGRKTRIGSQ